MVWFRTIGLFALAIIVFSTTNVRSTEARPPSSAAGDAEALSLKGIALYEQGKSRDAELLLRQALAVRRSKLGENHLDTASSYNNLAVVLDDQGRYREAEPMYRKALDIFRAKLGKSNPNITANYNDVASNLNSQGRFREAELFFRKALDFRRAALGESDPDTATSYDNLASNVLTTDNSFRTHLVALGWHTR